MDIKRSNRIKKAAAIAALVLVVGGASVAAEVGNAGFLAGDVVKADSLDNNSGKEVVIEKIDSTKPEPERQKQFEDFVNKNINDGKIHVLQLTDNILPEMTRFSIQ